MTGSTAGTPRNENAPQSGPCAGCPSCPGPKRTLVACGYVPPPNDYTATDDIIIREVSADLGMSSEALRRRWSRVRD